MSFKNGNHPKSEWKKGVIPWNKGKKGLQKNPKRSFLNKINPPHKGYKHSDRTKKIISEKKKQLYKEGKTISFNLGKHLSNVTKEKISRKLTTINHNPKKCLSCQKLFIPRNEKHKFCSIECFGIWESGEKNFLWNGGKSFEKYPKEWRKLRKIIRERDNNKCKTCGIEKKYLKENLIVHHIDENKQNISKENLISLCRMCHTRIHRKKIN